MIYRYITYILFFAFSHNLKAQLVLEASQIDNLPDSIAERCDLIHHFIRLGESNKIPPDSGLHYLALAEKISLDICEKRFFLAIKARRGQLYGVKGELTASLAEYAMAMPYLRRGYALDGEDEAWFLVSYANRLYSIGLYEEAQSIYRQAQRGFDDCQSDYGNSVSYINQGLCALRLELAEEALVLFDSAVQLRSQMHRPHLLAHALLYKTRAYLALEEISKAQQLFAQADELFKLKDENYDFRREIQTERAEVLMRFGRYQEARETLRKVGVLMDGFVQISDLKLFCESLERSEELDSLRYYAQMGLQEAKKVGNYGDQIFFIQQLLRAAKAQGDLDQFLVYQKQFSELYERSREQRLEVFRVMQKSQNFLIQEQEKNRSLLQANQEKQKLIQLQQRSLITGAVFILLFLGLSIGIYRLYRKLVRTRSRLSALGQRVIIAGNAMDLGLIYLDKDASLQYFNRRAEELYLKVIKQKLRLGENFSHQLKNQEVKKNWQSIIRQAPQRQNWQQTLVRSSPEGLRYFMLSLASIKHQGEYKGLVAVISDITAEQQRNNDLANKSRELELANKAKERVISLLAHDLKEGVIAPLELVKVLQQQPALPAEEREEYLELILRSLKKTKTLLFKTLDWVKEQKESFKLQEQALDLRKITEDILADLQENARQKKVEWKVSIEPNLFVKTDPEMLRSVLRNLLQNAIKYSLAQGGVVKIEAKILTDQRVQISIRDQGVGLDPRELNRILNREVQSSRKGTAGEAGSGVGLSMCQDLLNLMGSSLQIESEQDQGSHFFFELDFIQSEGH